MLAWDGIWPRRGPFVQFCVTCVAYVALIKCPIWRRLYFSHLVQNYSATDASRKRDQVNRIKIVKLKLIIVAESIIYFHAIILYAKSNNLYLRT